ncbi:protein UpsX [Metallosphaera cuprina]|uniref:Uncharacterized protein n=1 Tax=Metallosphaera cuprina (strain Ar-4) TaxID=1006006 RepID=F4FYQ4_METCR|nr:conserved hypothetical protein [Metallosphaera cuprina Ar-4]
MDLPKIDQTLPLFIPDGVESFIYKSGDSFYVLTSALVQPIIRVFPSLLIRGEVWMIQRGNTIIEIESGKEKTLNCVKKECLESQDLQFVTVKDNVMPVISKRDMFLYNGEHFSTFKRRVNISYLHRKDKTVVFTNNNEYFFDNVTDVGITRAGVSLIREGYTELITPLGDKIIRKIEGKIAFINSSDVIYQDKENRIWLNDNLLGFCNSNFDILAKGHGWVVGLCGTSARYYFHGNWIELANNVDGLKSDASENFIGLVTLNESKIFDLDLRQRYSIIGGTLGIGSRKMVLIAKNKLFILDIGEFYKIRINVNKEENLISLTYPSGYSIKKNDLLATTCKITHDGIVEENLEYLGHKSEEEIIVQSDIGEQKILLSFNRSPIEGQMTGIIYIAEGNGKAKSGRGNAVLVGEFILKQKVRSRLRLNITIADQTKSIDINDIKTTIRETFNIVYRNSDIFPVYYELTYQNRTISRGYSTSRVVIKNVPKMKRRIKINRGHVLVDIERAEDELFIWDTVRVRPTYKQPINFIQQYSEKNLLNNKISFYLDKNGTIKLKLGQFLKKLDVWIEGNYIHVIPHVTLDSIIQVYYATYVYTGLPEHIIFPLDPVYSKIIVKIFIGDVEIQKMFTIDSLKLCLKVALQTINELASKLKNIGLE